MTDVQYIPPGFKDTFTRLFSVLTIIFSLLLFLGIMPPPFLGGEDLALYMFILGFHGVITNPKNVGTTRRLFCNISGAAATIFMIYSVVLFFKTLGLIGA
jgi:hypothetical protein